MNSYNNGKSNGKYKHGHSGKNKSETYWAWHAMLQRCNTKSDKRYKDYGGRGIEVCDRWFSFSNFLLDMGEKPKGETLDRQNNNKGYTKSNCRWVTVQVNCQNRRTTVLNKKLVLEIRKLKNTGMLIKDIAAKLNINYGTCRSVTSGKSWSNIQ